jgi:hypothetical protein
LMILLTYSSVGQITKCMLLGGRWGESWRRKHSLMTTSKKIHRKSIISFGVPAILQVPQMIFRIVFFWVGNYWLQWIHICREMAFSWF